MKGNDKFRLMWNGELKKLAFSLVLMAMAAILLGNLWLIVYQDSLRRENNIFLATVMGNVVSFYPDVSEVQLIQLLNDTANREKGFEMMARYGIFVNDGRGGSSVGVERQLGMLQVCANLFFAVLTGSISVFFFFYVRKRQGKIEKLTLYMEALNRDGYSLEIEDNDDDELSSLRNEIYKLTVFLKEQAERAVSQRRALADSVANISHQLKTPLTSMTVLVDNLSENMDMDERTRRRFLGEVTRQLSGMSWLIATMLKLSRLEAGVVALEGEKCSVEELVGGATRKLETMAELAEVTFQVEIEGEAALFVDRNWTTEALVNLMKNAVEHSPAGSAVTIFGAENDIYTELRITDQGEGITEWERQKLFQRFYRGDIAKEDSTGLGLALAKEIVELQGGHISVDSKKDKGTVFSIKFLKQ